MDIGTALFLEKESTKDVHTYECQIIDQDDKHVYIDFPTHQETRERRQNFQKERRLKLHI